MDSVELGVEEEEAPDASSPRANPCDALTNLVQPDGAAMRLVSQLGGAAARVRGAFAAPALGRDYALVEVVGCEVAAAAEAGKFELKARARFDGCGLELAVSGGSLVRSARDFEWLRACLRESYAGCVVPPITAEVYEPSGGVGSAADALERFLGQCLAHGELHKAPELSCFCVSDAAELDDAKAAFGAAAAAARSPYHVRFGAVVLDVVGNDTPVGAEDLEGSPAELAAAKRKEKDVRELYAWAKEQVFAIGKAEKDANSGARALRAFDEASSKTRTALASRFADEPKQGELPGGGGGAASTSGPAKALAALREMVGLAKALTEAVEDRDRVRLQYVAAKNGLALNRKSNDAREALVTASESQAKTADELMEAAAVAEPAAAAAAPAAAPPAPPAEAAPAPAASPETEDPSSGDDGSRGARALLAYGALRAKVVAATTTAYAKVADLHLLDKLPERERVAALARKGATVAAALGSRVVSTAALGAAKISSDEADVERYEKLIADLGEAFAVADARLQTDAPKLKKKWDDLQIDAYSAFVRGEASRADGVRAAADGAALQLVNMKVAQQNDAGDQVQV